MENLIIDCFAGGGGASVGIEMAASYAEYLLEREKGKEDRKE